MNPDNYTLQGAKYNSFVLGQIDKLEWALKKLELANTEEEYDDFYKCIEQDLKERKSELDWIHKCEVEKKTEELKKLTGETNAE